MAPALAGPTPGSRDSSSAGAVFRLTTPSTPLPARARPEGSTPSNATTRMAARGRTPGCRSARQVGCWQQPRGPERVPRPPAMSSSRRSRLSLTRYAGGKWSGASSLRGRRRRSARRGSPRAARSLRRRSGGKRSRCGSRCCWNRRGRSSVPRSSAAHRGHYRGRSRRRCSRSSGHPDRRLRCRADWPELAERAATEGATRHAVDASSPASLPASGTGKPCRSSQ